MWIFVNCYCCVKIGTGWKQESKLYTCSRTVIKPNCDFKGSRIRKDYFCRLTDRRGSLRNFEHSKMFVIGVSGVTCGGKTTLSQLLQRSFPWCRVIYQDSYFFDDDDPRHVRLEEVDHVNYEILSALNMEQMEKDVVTTLQEDQPILGTNGDGYDAPNFETSGKELLDNVQDIGFDTSKYRKVPILLLEGFTIFGSELLFDKCDARFFLTLTKQECYERRSKRTTYIPPDTPGYFEKCIWPEFTAHYESCIANNPGIQVFNGTTPLESVWKESVEMIAADMEKKFPQLIL
ncbi:unnamed protein product [Allacma fusca]|uniref:Nicotinamide riboside kinase 1 n=1 Tax=Allacma fusca TaxID=39272 RepID=A0A8J2PXN6_9HEXA|nr:unnamed protein product [Allacma fusca]